MNVNADAIDATARAAVTALGLGIVESALLAGAVWLVLRFCSAANAATRHLLWWIVLGTSAVLPLATLASSVAHVQHRTVPAAFPDGAVRLANNTISNDTISLKLTNGGGLARIALRAWPADGATRHVSPSPFAAAVPAIARVPYLASALLALWLGVAFAGVFALGRGLVSLRAIKRDATRVDARFIGGLRQFEARARRGRRADVRASADIDVPVAVGFRSPAILIPAALLESDASDVDQIAIHEYAHLERYDDWTNLAQHAIERFFWFHPVIAFAGRRIALEREIACDDRVVAQTGRAHGYAHALWKLLEAARRPARSSVAPGAFHSPKALATRIERLLGARRAGSERPSRIGAAAVAAVAIALVVIAAGRAPVIAVETFDDIALVKAAVHPHARILVAKITAPKAVALAAPVALSMRVAEVSPAPLAATLAPVARRTSAASAVPVAPAAPLALGSPVAFGLSASAQPLSPAVAASAKPAPLAPSIPSGDVRGELERCNIGCDLSGRDLRGGDVHGLRLIDVKLSHANLRGADLHDARLVAVDLSQADLAGANLRGAHLEASDLRGARIDGADFTGAFLTGLDGVDLSQAQFAQAHVAGEGGVPNAEAMRLETQEQRAEAQAARDEAQAERAASEAQAQADRAGAQAEARAERDQARTAEELSKHLNDMQLPGADASVILQQGNGERIIIEKSTGDISQLQTQVRKTIVIPQIRIPAITIPPVVVPEHRNDRGLLVPERTIPGRTIPERIVPARALAVPSLEAARDIDLSHCHEVKHSKGAARVFLCP